jgi:hypothetical protein
MTEAMPAPSEGDCMTERPSGDDEPGARGGLRLGQPEWAAQLEDAQRRAGERRRELDSGRRERLRLEAVVLHWLRTFDER